MNTHRVQDLDEGCPWNIGAPSSYCVKMKYVSFTDKISNVQLAFTDLRWV